MLKAVQQNSNKIRLSIQFQSLLPMFNLYILSWSTDWIHSVNWDGDILNVGEKFK